MAEDEISNRDMGLFANTIQLSQAAAKLLYIGLVVHQHVGWHNTIRKMTTNKLGKLQITYLFILKLIFKSQGKLQTFSNSLDANFCKMALSRT